MNIHIDFTGIPKVLCQLGIHNWFDEDGFNSKGELLCKICRVCGKEKIRNI